jgi:hypothetical protein
MSNEDYFGKVQALPLGKRRLTRLDTKRVLQRIARQSKGWDEGWTEGKFSFMKSYPTKTFPRNFAKSGDKVHLQVSIRLVLGQTAKDAPVAGLKGLEVYYRYMKTIAVINKKDPKDDVDEEERDESIEFETTNINQATDWVGTLVSESEMARSFYRLISSIGESKIERIIQRMKKRN